MSLAGQQENPSYYWEDGGLLKDAPVDFDATFAENMWISTKPIRFTTFYRNPLKVVPNFTVPRPGRGRARDREAGLLLHQPGGNPVHDDGGPRGRHLH